jgi:hypothetical protein
MFAEILNDPEILHDEKVELVLDELEKLGYGIYDVADIPRVRRPSDVRDEKGYQAVIDFLLEHPEAVYAVGYESETVWVLAKRPERVFDDDTDFNYMYGTPILEVEKYNELMFILDH